MRRVIILAVLGLLCAALCSAQSNSPESLYDRGVDAITGVGPMHDDVQGVDYFRRSAELGYGPAQIALGYYYETGGTIPKDTNQALELYRKAAQTGDPLAAWLAGRLYFLGNGVPHDMDAAQKWLKISASLNNAYGAYYLARLVSGRGDDAKAVPLYKIAADQGLPQAQYYYGKALKEGRGITRDRLNAYAWLTVAADAGYNAASQDLVELSRSGALNLEQIAEAKTKARDMEQVVLRAINARGCAGWTGEFDEMPTPPPPPFQRYCH
jgi:TPR repeat protein